MKIGPAILQDKYIYFLVPVISVLVGLMQLPWANAADEDAAATEQTWQPEKPITIIAPSNPGGGWDQTARFMQLTIMSENLSPVSIEVVNRGGAGGLIGLAELVERYAGDSHKLMIGGFTMTGAVLMHGSDYSLMSTTPIARLVSEYQTVAVPAASPYQSLEDLLNAFRENPADLIWGGGSAGGSDHFFVNLLAEKLDISPSKVNYVAFTGGGEAAAALMGGQVVAAVSGFAEWGGLEEAGRIRILGVSSEVRVISPTLKTFREVGVDLVFQNWRCVVAPPGISPEVRAWMTDMVTKMHNTPAWQDVLVRNSWQDSFLIGPEFEQFIIEDSEVTQRILSRIGLGAGGKGYAPIGPYLFPGIVGAGMGLLALFMFVPYMRQRRAMKTGAPIGQETAEPGAETLLDMRRFGIAVAVFLVYILALRIIGFIFAAPIFLVVFSRIIGSRSPLRDLIAGIALTAFIVLIFDNLLHVDVP